MRQRITLLPLIFVALACGGPAQVAQPVEPSDVVTQALTDAVRLIRTRRLDEAEDRLARVRLIAARDEHNLEKLDYYIATVLAYRGDVGRALRLVHAHAVAAAGRHDVDSEVWMQSCAAWLRWAVDDIDGAIAENDRIVRLLTDEVDSMDRKAMATRHLWDRAFFLVEKAHAAPEGERDAAQRAATAARDEYDAYVRELEDKEDSRLLASWFAFRRDDRPGASKELGGDLDVEDVRGLFIQAVVLEGAPAARAKDRLRNTVNLLAALLERKTAQGG